MKKIILLSSLFIIGCTAETVTEEPAKSTYITDNDFTIEIVSYEEKIDYTNDGVINFTEVRTNENGVVHFTKQTNNLMNEVYNSSDNGLLVINNYWGVYPKVLDFTVYGQITTVYDSTWDNQATTYEYSETKIIYNQL